MAKEEVKINSVLDIAKKLNKEWKDKNLALAANVVPDFTRLATGSFGFDYPLFGGLVLGRICTFAGLYHSGKTTAACVAMAAF